MGELNKRFEEAIRKSNFNIFEVTGFRARPALALITGMAIGYKMACEDLEKKLNP